MKTKSLTILRLELSVKVKNGVNFILAASIVWSIITVLWYILPDSSKSKAMYTLIFAPMPLLPLAWMFSKLFSIEWSVKDNALSPFGLWLNFAQLFYFPFLIFIYSKNPTYFVMVYAIITGAHFFPYAWFYHGIAYAVMAGIISVGSFVIAVNVPEDQQYYVSAFVTMCLLVLIPWLMVEYKRNTILLERTSQQDDSKAKQ